MESPKFSVGQVVAVYSDDQVLPEIDAVECCLGFFHARQFIAQHSNGYLMYALDPGYYYKTSLFAACIEKSMRPINDPDQHITTDSEQEVAA